jgi:hypothetical protein
MITKTKLAKSFQDNWENDKKYILKKCVELKDYCYCTSLNIFRPSEGFGSIVF